MIRTIEELSMNAWPALKSYIYDGWVLRMSNGYTKRGNAIYPIHQSKMCIDEKVEFCESLYMKHGLPVIFKITEDVKLKLLDNYLEKKNYKSIDRTAILMMNIDKSYEKDSSLHIHNGYSEKWVNEYILSRDVGEGSVVRTMKMMLSNIFDDVFYITYRVNNYGVGFGYGVICKEYLGIHNIYVDKNFRRHYIGERLLKGILDEGYRRGATKAYLQVVKGNNPAGLLYNKLGFREQYNYWYRKLDC